MSSRESRLLLAVAIFLKLKNLYRPLIYLVLAINLTLIFGSLNNFHIYKEQLELSRNKNVIRKLPVFTFGHYEELGYLIDLKSNYLNQNADKLKFRERFDFDRQYYICIEREGAMEIFNKRGGTLIYSDFPPYDNGRQEFVADLVDRFHGRKIYGTENIRIYQFEAQ